MTGTMIQSPTNIKKGHGQRTSGAASGVASGAMAGAALGPVGVAVGAVVGGIAGLVSGNMGDASALYANKANAWAKIGQEREAAIARRDYVRQYRMVRAAAMLGIGSEEGGSRSSAPAGAIGSVGSQLATGLGFAEGQHTIQRNYSRAMNKAKKFAAASETTFAMFDAGFSMVGAGAKAYGTRPIAHAPISSGNSYIPSWTENYLSGVGQKFSWNMTSGK